MNKQTRNTLLLVLAAMVWGTAFAVQSGETEIGACTFLAGRCWLAVLFLLGLSAVTDRMARRRGERAGWPQSAQGKRSLYWGGFWCGTTLFAYFITQRIGVVISDSPSKAIFLNTLYVIFVPLLGLLLGRRPPHRIWLCMVLSMAGMYLLCLQQGLAGMAPADLLMIGGGVLFAVNVLTVNRWAPGCSGIKLSLVEFAVMGCWATAGMLLFETPTLAAVADNFGTMVYCGVVSSGIGFTLQIVGQKDLNPSIASLALSLESVFCALFSWLFLNDRLTPAELAGCTLMFGSVLLSQLPVEIWLKKALHKQ